MSTEEFIKTVTEAILKDRNHRKDNKSVECVWYNYTLGNIKALFIVIKTDNTISDVYYEATYSKETDDIWIDVYIRSYTVKL